MNVIPSLFVGISVAGSHDVMDCVPIETSVDDTSVGLAGSNPTVPVNVFPVTNIRRGCVQLL